MEEVKRTRKPKSPIKKSVTKVLKMSPETEQLNIPTIQQEVVNVEQIDLDVNIEEELLSFGYIPLNNINIYNNEEITQQYVKAVNQMGQKVYILLDDDIHNLDSDLNLVETKNGNILPYSLKTGALKMAAMDASGVAFECDQGGLCVLRNIIDNDNLTSVESNFTFVEENPSIAVHENYGCHMSYPVVKLSEIRVNNALVMHGADMVTRKLRNASYTTYLEDMKNVQLAINELSVQNANLINLFEFNAAKLSETLKTLEEWNKYYLENPPTTECDIKKHNLIIHNMRIRNDYISYLICGMKRIAEYEPQINKFIENNKEYHEFFISQFDNLDMASNI